VKRFGFGVQGFTPSRTLTSVAPRIHTPRFLSSTTCRQCSVQGVGSMTWIDDVDRWRGSMTWGAWATV